ncbi:MAG: putative Ig domain-containing protein, partial [Actinobacteria bacterium]|nr:putative Ig domain-containing protein [Actinomycetota bacterium]
GLIVIMMAGLTTFFVNVTGVTNVLRNRQNAAMFADQTVDQIRAMQPSDTYAGRSSTSVNAQWSAAPAAVAAALVNMTKMSDNSGSPIKLAASQTQAMNGVTYTAQNYLGSCSVPVAPTDGTACTTSWPNTVSTANYLRVVVGVTWTDKRCNGGQCSYVTTTLLSTDSDPNFLLNQTPPAAPVIVDPGAQTSAIGDAVSLQLALAGTGVTPITWTTYVNGVDTLPPGLSIDNTGLISGTPQGPATSGSGQSVTVSATDAFGRTDSSTFYWQVLPDLVPTGPTPFTGPVGVAITAIQLSATGGAGSPYTWSAPAAGQTGALPAGLSMTSGGSITGTPTTAGTFVSTITVADSAGRSRPMSYTFTVLPPPSLTLLESTYSIVQKWTVAQPVGYSCPSGACTFTLAAGSPAGLKVSSTATGAGGSSVAVTATTGTVYLVGIVTANPASYTVKLTPTDTRFSRTGTAAQATWTVTASGTLLANLTVNRGQTIAAQKLNYSCITACTIDFDSQLSTDPTVSLSGNYLATSTTAPLVPSLSEPAGSGTFYVRGGPASTDTAGTYTLTLTITDTAGATSTDTATWTVR